MSESTAARCLEAWNAVIGALIEVGRLPDPAMAAAKRGAPSKPKTATTPVETAVETLET